MRRSFKKLQGLLWASLALSLALLLAKAVPAGFSGHDYRTHIEIDGVDYGPFDEINGLDQFIDGLPASAGQHFVKVSLKREFVTSPSLYLWAKYQTSRKFGLKDISLITTDEQGNVVGRKILRLCQPLSWTVESANPSLGGYNEQVDIAVQQLEVY